MPGRRILRLLLAGIAALAVLWVGAWFLIAGRIEAGVADWAAARRAEGGLAEYRALAVGGFPLGWTVAIEAPAMTGPPPLGGSWRGERVIAEIRPWSPLEIPLRLPGRHRLDAGGPVQPTVIEAERPHGVARLDGAGRLVAVELDLGAARILEPPAAAGMRAARLRLSVRPHQVAAATSATDTLDTTIAVEDLDLPRAPANGLGQRIARLETDTGFMGRLPAAPLGPALQAWRESGGTVEMRRVTLRWGPLELDGDGTMALDEAMRPMGAFTMQLRGWAETIDALQRGGTIRPRDATAAKIALGLLARQPQPGDAAPGRPTIRVPLSAQNGQLFVAGFPIMRIDPIRVE